MRMKYVPKPLATVAVLSGEAGRNCRNGASLWRRRSQRARLAGTHVRSHPEAFCLEEARPLARAPRKADIEGLVSPLVSQMRRVHLLQVVATSSGMYRCWPQ
jgi:hypothetical protein